jgi:predicted XRE-type DNA-binding protein
MPAKPTAKRPAIRKGRANVFTDLGFAAEEAEHLRIRADLMIVLTRAIEAQGLSQAAAAKLLGVSQPRVSDLKRGKIDRFSIDTLVTLLAHAGIKVAFSTRRVAHVA